MQAGRLWDEGGDVVALLSYGNRAGEGVLLLLERMGGQLCGLDSH
jgi:hypothetical protein